MGQRATKLPVIPAIATYYGSSICDIHVYRIYLLHWKNKLVVLPQSGCPGCNHEWVMWDFFGIRDL